MSGSPFPRHGHVVMIATLAPGGNSPSAYRGYIVAEDDPQQAKFALADRVFDGETAHILGIVPNSVLRTLQLHKGMMLRL